MIAVIVATGPNPEFHGFDDHLPVELIPLGDRPFLQHVVESLIQQGIRIFHFLLNHLPQTTEVYLGDGARWGCSFSYHLVPTNQDPYGPSGTISSIVRDSNQDVILGRANYLPDIQLQKIHSDHASRVVTIWTDDGQGGRANAWSGWALLPKRLAALDLADLTDNRSASADDEGSARIVAVAALSAETGRQFLESQKEILASQSPHSRLAGLQVEPAIWMSRSVSLDPTAKLISPVYIGSHCRIGPHARIGPFAVIGNNCFVGAHTKIENAIVCPGTYVGEALELKTAIVDRSRLLNVDLGASLSVSEAFLLSGLAEHGPVAPLRRLMDQVIAGLLLMMLSPLLLITWAILAGFGWGGLRYQEFVQTPTDEESLHWRTRRLYRLALHREAGDSRLKHFLLRFAPGLLSVLMGDLSLVGVRPRTAEEIRHLPHDLRAPCLRTKAGLITETEIVFGINPTDDESYIGETYYSTAESLSYDLRLLGKFVLSFSKMPENRAEDVLRREDILEESSRT